MTVKEIIFRISKWVLRIVGILLLLIIAVLFFFSWQADQREAKRNVDAASATGRLVRAADIQVFIQEAGPSDGMPVLLVHGTGAWSEIWRETMEYLASNGFRVIALDVPPFGYSDKPLGASSYSRERQATRIISVLDTFGIDKVNLVGHSVGARPSIEAALNAQNRIQSLVLVDPALGFSPDGTTNFQQNNPSVLTRTFFAIKPLRNAALATYGTNPLFTKKLFQSFVSIKTAITDERVAVMQRPLVVEGMTRAQGDWLEYFMVHQDNSKASNFSNFKNFNMPVLIIWGESDNVTPLWQGKRLAELIPNSELEIMRNVGHIPYIEDTENFNRLLLKFLNKTNEKN